MKINWYPGHMKKTKDLITDHLKLIDVVVELLDARIPESSRNPQLDELIGEKKRIVALNKFDLADPEVVDEWVAHYDHKGIKAIPINSVNGFGVNRLLHEVKSSCSDIHEAMEARGRKPRAIRVMIVGIPNVGKSSLINKLAGKKTAKTGNKPGVTKGKQWIRIRKGLELFDTPGILWPKIEDEEVGMKLAFTGAIKDEIMDIENLAFHLIRFLEVHYPKVLVDRYDLADDQRETIETMDAIGRRRGCVLPGDEIDYHKVAVLVLDEFRKGILGQISLELPEEIEA